MSHVIELIRPLDPCRDGQTRELYTVDGEYVVLSTIGSVRTGDVVDDAIIDMAGLMSAMLGGGYATSGEETMAFRADKNGEELDFTDVAVANGVNSRARCLEALERDGLREYAGLGSDD